jgi:hypothetical protein
MDVTWNKRITAAIRIGVFSWAEVLILNDIQNEQHY